MASSNKHKYWRVILYPESAISDWREEIKQRGLQFAVSPIHEFDVDERSETGELKKPHHHLLLAYPASTTYQNVKSLTVDTLNATIPKVCDNPKGAYDYFTHKHDPDKFQYNPDYIEHYNGFDIDEIAAASEMEKAEFAMSIIDDIERYKIREYSELLRYYKATKDFKKFNYATSHTFFLKGYCDSRRFSSIEFVSDDEFIKILEERSKKDGNYDEVHQL